MMRRILGLFALSLLVSCTAGGGGDDPPACGTPPDSKPICRSECSYLCGMQCGDICGAFGCWTCEPDGWQFVSYDCEVGCGQPSDASVDASP